MIKEPVIIPKPKTPTKQQPIIKIETPIQKPVKIEALPAKIEATIVKIEAPPVRLEAPIFKIEEPPKPKFDLILDDDETIKQKPLEQPLINKPVFKPYPGGGGGSKP